MKTFRRLQTIMLSAACTVALAGCAPAVQKASIASATAQQVTSKNVTWAPLLGAVNKSSNATEYLIKSDVKVQNGKSHTDYSVYGTINLPNTASLNVHENNFNVSLYQQGQVAYADDSNAWIPTTPLANLDAYAGFVKLVRDASTQNVKLEQMNRTYVVDEYCDVYRFTVPEGSTQLPDFLKKLAGNTPQTKNVPIQYTMYVGENSGYLRQVQTASVNQADQLGPILTNTTTIFFNIQNDQLAKVQIPKTLVSQLQVSIH